MLNFLAHEGVAHDHNPPGRGSGRWPYGSGENPGQHQYTFMSEVQRYRKKGISDGEIAKALLGPNATTADLKAEIAIQHAADRRADVYKARQLMEECGGNVSEVGRRMGKNESTVRKLLDKSLEESQDRYKNTAEYLKNQIDKKGVIAVGPGAEVSLNVTSNTMKVAIAMLEKEGYIKAQAQIPQLTGRNKTNISVLCPPGTDFKEHTNENGKTTKYIDWTKNQAHTIEDYSPNEGLDYDTLKKPVSLDSSRVKIIPKEDGGALKDGVIEIRPGVKDLDLGNSRYAQVRIAVDGTKYLKGMAIYGDPDAMPKGIDILVNSNKSISNIDAAYKDLKVIEATGEIDWNNPFGALIKRGGQSFYEDKNGNYIKNERGIFVEAKKGDSGERYSLSPINKLREEGDWDTWDRTLSAQFLSKQPLKVINQQINISLADKRNELSDIMNLTNPVIKQKMLEDFANKCDANAADLSVKGVKGQAYRVILPITNMKDNEIYAPSYKDGDTVALIRYPHGGTFEIPILKVNNNHNEPAKKILQNVTDAVGVTPHVAEILSGADFDGDFVAVVPLKSNRLAITSTPQLEALKGFDTKSYKLPDSAPNITNKRKQIEMGKATNLITDMTIQGANEKEIVRAVKHSMVVIDSEKHHLDYKQSFKDNRIADLKKDYQSGGASTIFSRSNAERYVNQRKEITDKNKMTPEELKLFEAGKKVYRDSGKTRSKTIEIKDPREMTSDELKRYNAGLKVKRYTNEKVLVQEKVAQRALVKDAMELVHDKSNIKEVTYARYSNELSAMADQARREMRSIKPVPVNQTAKKTYAAEVKQLNEDLKVAKANKPRENIATNIAAIRASEAIKANPYLDYEHKSRIRAQEMERARDEVGAHKKKIVITDREWEAIQANAISTNKLKEILENTDTTELKKRATPKDINIVLTPAKISLMETMYNSGMYTQKDIAERLGISVSTVSKTLRGGA